jgi:hypothetical protein
MQPYFGSQVLEWTLKLLTWTLETAQMDPTGAQVDPGTAQVDPGGLWSGLLSSLPEHHGQEQPLVFLFLFLVTSLILLRGTGKALQEHMRCT